MKRWTKVAVLLLGLALASTTACTPFGGDEEETSQQLVEVVRGDLMVSISGSGNIVVADEAKLAFGSSGKIAKIYVDEDDEVRKGQVLAKLDTGPLELALAQAKAALAQAKYALEQAEEPFSDDDIESAEAAVDAAEEALYYAHWMLDQAEDAEDEAATPQDEEEAEALVRQWQAEVSRAKANLVAAEAQLDAMEDAPDEDAIAAAEAQLEAAEQAVAEAQKQLDEATISAPFDGVVVSVAAEEGDIILSTVTIIHLIDPTTMEMEVEVDEIDIPGVKLGQRAIIDVDALPGVPFEGEVTSIATLSTELGGVVLYKVKIGLTVPEGSGLKAGMSVDADIVINERTDVLLVPNRAITQDSQGNPIVKVVVNEEVEERAVVTGISDGFETEIVNGLNKGEMVLRKAS